MTIEYSIIWGLHEKKIKVVFSLLAAANMIGVITGDAALAAETAKRNNYIQGQAGMFLPAADLDDADFDNGFNGSFSYGRYLTEYLKVEGTLDLSAMDRDSSGVNSTTGNYSRDDQLSASGILVALKGEYPAGPFDLFGGVGIGMYGIQLNSEVDSQRFGSFDKDDSDTVFGAQLSLGTNYNINERFYIGVEGKYRWTEDADISMTTAAVPIAYSGDLSGYSVAFTAGWRF